MSICALCFVVMDGSASNTGQSVSADGGAGGGGVGGMAMPKRKSKQEYRPSYMDHLDKIENKFNPQQSQSSHAKPAGELV